jgi:hypothetical protein
MSFCEWDWSNIEVREYDQWICDGPNDSTTKTGCLSVVDVDDQDKPIHSEDVR